MFSNMFSLCVNASNTIMVPFSWDIPSIWCCRSWKGGQDATLYHGKLLQKTNPSPAQQRLNWVFNIFLGQVVFSLEVNFFILISMILCDQCAQAYLSYVFTADNVSSITQCKFPTLQHLLFQPSHCRNKRKSSLQRWQFQGDTVEVGILHSASNCLKKLFKTSLYL